MPQKVYGFQGSVEDLTDVTAVGKDVIQSETAADIRAAIEAASTTDLNTKVSNASGTTMRLRGYGITAPTTGNQTGDVWFVQG